MLPWLLLAALLGLLVTLGSLQMHWLGQVAEADAERTRTALESGASTFARTFDSELVRLALEVPASIRRLRSPRRNGQPIGEQDVAEALALGVERWRQLARFPEMLEAIYVLEPLSKETSTDPSTDPAAMTVRRLRIDDAWEPDASALWVAETVDAEHPLGSWLASLDLERVQDAGLLPVFADDLPGLSMPLDGERGGRRFGSRWRRRAFDGPGASRRSLVLLLDAEVLATRVFAELAREAFGDGSGALPVRVRVVDQEPRRLLFAAGPEVPDDAVAEVRRELFGAFLGGGPPEDGMRDGALRLDRLRRALLDDEGDPRQPPGPLPGRWALEVVHPAGSLTAAVDRARRSNAALGLGMLLLLAASAAFLAVSAVRARRLAARQLDFLAAVTHELLTPLSALRAAGQNLAAGIVREPDQIARYGTTIDEEAARLTGTVQRVLAFAGGVDGRRRWRPRPVDPQAAIRDAVEVLRPALDAAGADVQIVDDEQSSHPPPVLVDPEALALALHNLLGNAVKYGRAEDGSLTIRAGACPTPDQRWVWISVSDDGPGVHPGDRRDLFEPFTRGRALAASAVAGSGLGLALVDQVARAHGGRVFLADADLRHPVDRGATFILELPRAEAGATALDPTATALDPTEAPPEVSP